VEPATTTRNRRWLKRLAIGASLMVVLLLIAAFFFGRYVRAAVVAEDLEILLNDALSEATGGLYTASLEEIEWGSGGISLRLHDISLMLDRDVLTAMDAAGTLPQVIFQLQHATVDVTGIDLWSLLRGTGFHAYSLEIDEPLIQLAGLDDLIGRDANRKPAPEAEVETEGMAEEPADPEAPGAAPASVAAGGVELAEEPSANQRLRIWRVRLNDAQLESYRRQATDSDDIRDTFELYESFTDVNIAIDDLDFTDPDTSRLLFSDDVSIDIAEYYYLWPDGLHEERHGPISLSTSAGTLRVENFSLSPLFDRRTQADTDGERPAERRVTIESAAIEGLDLQALLRGKTFSAREFTMIGFNVEVVGDPPGDRAPGEAPVADLTAPVTGVRPGALLTDTLSGLPTIEVGRLRVERASAAFIVDRDAAGWLDATEIYYAVENFNFELLDYRSGPEVAFDPTRPLFAEGWDASAERIVMRVGEGRHSVQMANWRSTSAGRDLSVDGFLVEPVFDRRGAAARGDRPHDEYRVSTGPLELTGVDYGSLIDEVDVVVERMSLEDVTVHATVSEGGASGAPVPVSTPRIEDQLPAEAIGAILLGLPDVAISSVVLRDAVYERTVDRVNDVWLEVPVRRLLIDDLDMDFEVIQHAEGQPYDVARPLLADSTSATVGRVVVGVGDGFEELMITGISLTSERHDVTIESVHYGATTEDLDRLVQRVQQRSLVDVTTGNVTLVGAIIPRYLETGQWVADRLEIQEPRIRIYETRREAEADVAADTGTDNTESLAQFFDELAVIRVGEFVLTDAVYERRQAPPGYDWVEIPPPVGEIHNLDLRVSGFDTDPALGRRRLLLSERVEMSADEFMTPLGDSGSSLTLRSLALSSDSDTLTIERALLSTRDSDGDNDFQFDRNVPYGRMFRAMIEPRRRGAPVIAAMADKDLRVSIAGVTGDLDDGARALRTGAITGSAADGSLLVDGVSFGPTMPDADPTTPQLEVDDDEFVFRADRVALGGFDFAALTETGVMQASTLSLDEPYFAIVHGVREQEPAPRAADDREASTSLAHSIQAGLQGFPVVQIGEFRAHGFSVHELQAVDGEPTRELVDVDLTVIGLDLRPDRGPVDPAGPLYATDIRVEMPAQRTWLDNSVYEVEFGPIVLSTGRGSLDLGSAAYVPPYSVEQFLGRTRVIEGDRIEVQVGSLSLDEIDIDALLNTGAVVIGKARLKDWSVHILSDKHKPPNPNSGPPTYPHEAFQRLPISLSVAEIALENGAVRYSERHREGNEPGHIWWDRLGGTLTNLSNDPARMTFETPAVLSIGARMFDQAFLNLEWRLPLLEPGPTMSYCRSRACALQKASSTRRGSRSISATATRPEPSTRSITISGCASRIATPVDAA